MYNIKKQNELASIAITIFKINKNNYEEIANKLLNGIEEEKKERLSNYIKIIILSSNEKEPVEFENFKSDSIENIQEINILMAFLAVLELSIMKSKALKHDLRLKLLEELVSAIELNNRDLIKFAHRDLTKIIER